MNKVYVVAGKFLPDFIPHGGDIKIKEIGFQEAQEWLESMESYDIPIGFRIPAKHKDMTEHFLSREVPVKEPYATVPVVWKDTILLWLSPGYMTRAFIISMEDTA